MELMKLMDFCNLLLSIIVEEILGHLIIMPSKLLKSIDNMAKDSFKNAL